MKVKIGLVDDHAITRRGIRTLLEINKQFQVIVEASNGKELLSQLESGSLPDVIILDLSMPKMSGFDVIREIHTLYPSVKIFIFSLYQSEDVILNAIYQGACGYLPKSADPSILESAIKSVVDFGFYIPINIKKKYSDLIKMRNQKGFQGKQLLTEKEIQFIKLACTNLTYKEISIKLSVQPKTLENYRDSVFQKLGINNRAALTFYAIENGIVQLF
ncbi:response regulator transcription factor [Sediminibacterium goheungense]|uniref:LuxR family two component transcriptional regulator n=1 Tax=Sediminibacterium goheungense TaxID=1086393 RepID=A0A4R6J2R9_9BACT|nr:response regulator transcription factor [Sediminibacterium goheungense]TDO28566.1 LuxR family two component transcriptional regulator [Sediminibacterium goheungense]